MLRFPDDFYKHSLQETFTKETVLRHTFDAENYAFIKDYPIKEFHVMSHGMSIYVNDLESNKELLHMEDDGLFYLLHSAYYFAQGNKQYQILTEVISHKELIEESSHSELLLEYTAECKNSKFMLLSCAQTASELEIVSDCGKFEISTYKDKGLLSCIENLDMYNPVYKP